ncbi:MAG: radical SAM protein [Deltaproteobacteria bacterium]|nr:radical SAM protein [Deltaproteobacteria bacterium]
MLMHNYTLAILCGGMSSRLGSDKGLYRPPGEDSLIVRTLRLLGRQATEVLLVCHDPAQKSHYETELSLCAVKPRTSPLRIVTDQSAIDSIIPRSALTGIATALIHAKNPRVLVVAIDQLGVRQRHLLRLLQAAGPMTEQSVVTFSDASGDPLPFPSMWSTSTLPSILTRLANGAFSVRSAIRESTYLLLNFESETPGLTDPLLVNANTLSDMSQYFGKPLFDFRGRRLNYLRFSLTEACNMACTYCLPEGYPQWYRHKATLTLPQITTLLGGFRRLGFRKVRFTGGEPTTHRSCLQAVAVADSMGFETIAITTNGLLIGDLKPWINAGLTHLNVSLDSLDEDEFLQLTKSKELKKVLQLIEQAAALGIKTKVNTVLMRSVNGSRSSIIRLLDWVSKTPITLRFIELMDTGLNHSFAARERILGTDIEPLLIERGYARVNQDTKNLNPEGPAVNYAHPFWSGQIGLINPLSGNFCNTCNRLRITARGNLKLCLFGDQDSALDMTSPEAVALNVQQLIGTKPERHYLDVGNYGNVATFRTIGG